MSKVMAFQFTTRIGVDDLRLPLVDGEYSIGSAPDNDVVLVDPTVSRHHAELVVNGDKLRLRDCESRNGTQVNGRRITEAAVLSVGDRLALGHAEAVIEAIEDDELEAAIPGKPPPSIASTDVAGPSTLASGEFARFCITWLLPLTGRLGEGGRVGGFATSLADAMARSSPGTRFEIRRGGADDGVMAVAGEAPAAAISWEQQRGGWSIRVECANQPGRRMTLEALVTLALSLLALAEAGDRSQVDLSVTLRSGELRRCRIRRARIRAWPKSIVRQHV
jgi:hypothetical protein